MGHKFFLCADCNEKLMEDGRGQLLDQEWFKEQSREIEKTRKEEEHRKLVAELSGPTDPEIDKKWTKNGNRSLPGTFCRTND